MNWKEDGKKWKKKSLVGPDEHKGTKVHEKKGKNCRRQRIQEKHSIDEALQKIPYPD